MIASIVIIYLFRMNHCDKIKYNTFNEAERALEGIRARSNTRKNARAYKCEYCGYYHTTSGRKSKTLKAKKNTVFDMSSFKKRSKGLKSDKGVLINYYK